jgi:hypothetical protein
MVVEGEKVNRYGFLGLLTLIFLLSVSKAAPAGTTWTVRAFSNPLLDIAYGNGTFVAVGEDGAILTSPDGTTWTARNSGADIILLGVAYGNGTFVAVGEEGTLLTSPDGITWTARNSGAGTARNSGAGSILLGVTYGNGTFVVVGGGTILTSP